MYHTALDHVHHLVDVSKTSAFSSYICFIQRYTPKIKKLYLVISEQTLSLRICFQN